MSVSKSLRLISFLSIDFFFFVHLFGSRFYVSVNNFSVMSGGFPGLNQYY